MPPTGDNQIKALIKLLSDENSRIARTIEEKLIQIGDPAIPLLLEAEIEQPAMAQRIEGVLDEIRGSRVRRRRYGADHRGGNFGSITGVHLDRVPVPTVREFVCESR